MICHAIAIVAMLLCRSYRRVRAAPIQTWTLPRIRTTVRGASTTSQRTRGLVVNDGCPPLVCESRCAGVDAPVFGLVSMGVPHKVEGTRSTPRLPS